MTDNIKPVTIEQAAVRTIAARRLTQDALRALAYAKGDLDSRGLDNWSDDTVTGLLDEIVTGYETALVSNSIYLDDGSYEEDIVTRLDHAAIRVRAIADLLDDASNRLAGIAAGMNEQYKDDRDDEVNE